MDESLKSVLEYGYNTLDLSKIEAYTHRHNLSSKKLLERNGFELMEGMNDEGNLDNSVYLKNK